MSYCKFVLFNFKKFSSFVSLLRNSYRDTLITIRAHTRSTRIELGVLLLLQSHCYSLSSVFIDYESVYRATWATITALLVPGTSRLDSRVVSETRIYCYRGQIPVLVSLSILSLSCMTVRHRIGLFQFHNFPENGLYKLHFHFDRMYKIRIRIHYRVTGPLKALQSTSGIWARQLISLREAMRSTHEVELRSVTY